MTRLIDEPTEATAKSSDSGASDSSLCRRPLARLCALAALQNLKPSEPFLTAYLARAKHIPTRALNARVWPASTWGTCAALLPLGFAADALGSRPVILAGLLCRELARVLLLYGEGVGAMQLMQLAYGVGVAADSVFFAYVYSTVPRDDFARATAHVLASYHLGNVAGSLAGQLWVSQHDDASDPQEVLAPLFYASWATTTAAVIMCFFLPPPAATSIVLNYFQLQLLAVDGGAPMGLIEAGMEMAFAVGAMGVAPVLRLAGTRPLALLQLNSLLAALLYLSSALGAGARLLWLAAACNVGASAVYALQLAIASARLASVLPARHDAAFFTCFALLALGLASVVQAIGASLGADADDYYIAVSVLMLLPAVWSILPRRGESAHS